MNERHQSNTTALMDLEREAEELMKKYNDDKRFDLNMPDNYGIEEEMSSSDSSSSEP